MTSLRAETTFVSWKRLLETTEESNWTISEKCLSGRARLSVREEGTKSGWDSEMLSRQRSEEDWWAHAERWSCSIWGPKRLKMYWIFTHHERTERQEVIKVVMPTRRLINCCTLPTLEGCSMLAPWSRRKSTNEVRPWMMALWRGVLPRLLGLLISAPWSISHLMLSWGLCPRHAKWSGVSPVIVGLLISISFERRFITDFHSLSARCEWDTKKCRGSAFSFVWAVTLHPALINVSIVPMFPTLHAIWSEDHNRVSVWWIWSGRSSRTVNKALRSCPEAAIWRGEWCCSWNPALRFSRSCSSGIGSGCSGLVWKPLTNGPEEVKDPFCVKYDISASYWGSHSRGDSWEINSRWMVAKFGIFPKAVWMTEEGTFAHERDWMDWIVALILSMKSRSKAKKLAKGLLEAEVEPSEVLVSGRRSEG